MSVKANCVVVVFFVANHVVHADGCKFSASGRTVPEREQRALIEWDNGSETLFVATRTDPISEGNLWVVPVRANPKAARAEPVDEIPVVSFYTTLNDRAQRTLKRWIRVACVLDTGGLCCPFALGGFGCASDSSADKAIEESRIEKYGMVVTVVSAESREKLERYLDAQGVNRRVVDLSSLDPYFGQSDYSFVCGWVAKSEKPVTATGMKIVFPAPVIWFPLRPSRLNREPIDTVVYVRGFVKPVDGCDLPGLHCEYIDGDVKMLSVASSFDSRWPDEFGSKDLFTRVTLTTDPQKWDRDLELVPGTTPAGTVALAINGWIGHLAMLWSGLLGAILGLLIQMLMIPRKDRRRSDLVVGGIMGTAIIFSILASFVVYSLYRWQWFGEGPRHLRTYIVLPVLACAHFAIFWMVCQGTMLWLQTAG